MDSLPPEAIDDELLQEFLTESWENLGQLDQEIVQLEQDPRNTELISSIFRSIHTIKGTCGFLGLTHLGRVAHSTENVLGKLREGTLDVSPSAISIVLDGVDRIKLLLQGLEATRTEPQTDSSALIHRLDLLASLAGSLQIGPISAPVSRAVDSTPAECMVRTAPVAESVQSAPLPADSAVTASASVDAAATPVTTEVTAFSTGAAPTPESVLASLESSRAGAPEPTEVEAAGVDDKRPVAELSIRVHVNVLDRLMNLVGELVLTRNQLLQMVRGDDESRYAAPITHLNRVTTDLQEGVMKTRMQPIGHAWSKLPRLVRDLSHATGKRIELEMSGEDTELDRTILDAIRDPLTHMVRNSADHGLEFPEARQRLGKPPAGRITLTACHDGGHVIISISDDGAGIHREKVIRKAISQGMITEAEAKDLTDADVYRLIFRPGFSTAEQVTAISGRGVGMDVVKTAIERIGGTVELNSTPGAGTTVRVKIPLTLAIISALVVESGGLSFAIPQLGVVELVRVAAEDRSRIERLHNCEVFRLRDRLLPLVHLDSVLDLNVPESAAPIDVNIVVVQVGDDQFGLVVDNVFDTQEIVVKPVGSLLKDIALYQGTTILGDGRVILILDVAGIAATFGAQTSLAALDSIRHELNETGRDSTAMLLFGCRGGEIMAVPLALVSRLEEFPASAIERSAGRMVVQYRGNLLPLFPVEGASSAATVGDVQPVVVFSDGTQSLGLLVDQIVDIIDEPMVLQMPSRRPGVLGTAILNRRATDVLDAQHYLLQANPNWFRKPSQAQALRVLVVDDSQFFRQLLRTALEADGMQVIVAETGARAIALLEREQIDAVVSDVEMPGTDGRMVARAARGRSQSLPLVAITSLDVREYEQSLLEAGFDRVLAKFDPSILRSTLIELVTQRQYSLGRTA